MLVGTSGRWSTPAARTTARGVAERATPSRAGRRGGTGWSSTAAIRSACIYPRWQQHGPARQPEHRKASQRTRPATNSRGLGQVLAPFPRRHKTLTTPNPSLETGLAAARLLHPVDTRASVKHLGALKPPPPLPPPLLPPPPPPPPRLGGRPLLWLAAPGVANSGSRTALPPPPPPCDVFGAASVGVHSGSSADELSISVFPTLSRLSWLSSSSVRPRRRFL